MKELGEGAKGRWALTPSPKPPPPIPYMKKVGATRWVALFSLISKAGCAALSRPHGLT